MNFRNCWYNIWNQWNHSARIFKKLSLEKSFSKIPNHKNHKILWNISCIFRTHHRTWITQKSGLKNMCVGVLGSFWWVTILTVGLKIKFFCSLLIQYFENLSFITLLFTMTGKWLKIVTSSKWSMIDCNSRAVIII